MSEQRNSLLLSEIDDDAVTLVDAFGSRRSSSIRSRTVSNSSMTNRASLALARLVYEELVHDYTENTLNFLTSEDAEFVNAVARASKAASEVGGPFSVVYRRKEMTYIPSHWMELISTEVKRLLPPRFNADLTYRRLCISHNPISDLPSSLSLCQNLTYLNLRRLRLSEISRPVSCPTCQT
jgi:hypothetical protein